MKFPIKSFALSTAVALCWALPTLSAQAADILTGLGDLPGNSFSSIAYGVSADGSVVVGNGYSTSGFEAFRWTEAGGMEGLGYLTGGSYSQASDVSANGSVVVGQGNSASGTEAYRWSQGGGMVGLSDLAGGVFESSARGVNADGSVVVGYGTSTVVRRHSVGPKAVAWLA